MSKRQKIEEIAGLSAKTILLSMAGVLLFGIYTAILLYGENSFTILQHLSQKEALLQKQKITLKTENETLQKRLFELQQSKQD